MHSSSLFSALRSRLVRLLCTLQPRPVRFGLARKGQWEEEKVVLCVVGVGVEAGGCEVKGGNLEWVRDFKEIRSVGVYCTFTLSVWISKALLWLLMHLESMAPGTATIWVCANPSCVL
ncbi:hypothetical protein J5N97_006612 [Dioscorea zingiberensis]|uniref:Uncharacterized protein n=1 Tax=Dioscorea zingiberensis TaxID=325984 RepID=A0A9D5DAK4_9LILI|nr:hypothetical protein J5N97_006612 [Dioscorea zingiberensis]